MEKVHFFVDSHNGQSFIVLLLCLLQSGSTHIYLFSSPSTSPSLSSPPTLSLLLFRPPFLSLYSMLCSLECIQEHAVVVLMNTLSVLPVKGWGEEEEISSIWDAVIAIVTSNSGVCSCVLL